MSEESEIEVRMLGPDEAGVLERLADDVFDHALKSDRVAEFFADPRHHLAIALDDGLVVGMASGFHYVHPDKDPQLWINEVGVDPAWQRRGLGTRLVRCLVDHARALGCTEAWLLTERDNIPALSLYEALEGEEFAGGVVGFSWPTGVVRPKRPEGTEPRSG